MIQFKLMRLLVGLGISLVLASCASSGLDIDDFKKNRNSFAFDQFFNGPIKGWGIVQGIDGKVKRTFEVSMNGEWKGNTGTLSEHFVYDDGKTQDRTWIVTKTGADSFRGVAGDVIDHAEGVTAGNALEWNYEMDIKVDDDTYRLALDDWMFRMDDKVVVNRSYLKKFGITVAELTLFMQKQR